LIVLPYPLPLSSLKYFSKPELILAGEGSFAPLSKPLPLSDQLDVTIGMEKQVREGD
jgi:hypothetical protein